MYIYDEMSPDQAMLYIGGYDIYLKYQDNPDSGADDWFNLDISLNRAYKYHQFLMTIWQDDGPRFLLHQNTIENHYNTIPVFSNYELGSKEWFTQFGYCIYSIKKGTGYFNNRYRCDSRMQDFLNAVNCDAFNIALVDCINDGDTALYICDDCGAYCSHSTDTGEDTTVCQDCLDNDYSYDNHNEHYYYNHRMVNAINEHGDNILVNGELDMYEFTYDDHRGCYVHDDYEDEDENRVIRGYHSNGDNYYQVESAWTKANKRYFGVELEVEAQNNPENSARLIYEWFETNRPNNEQLFYEEDGSLSNGFEMISQPMGLDKHREIWKWVEQKNLIRSLRSHNTSTCGLHVHVSKAGLTALTISKAVCFVNNPTNKPLIKAIARRYSSGYCRAKHVTLADGAKRGDKYEMINLNKSQTIEFRIFRGSLNYNAIQASLEFSNAVLNFAAQASMEELTELKFLEFLYKPEQRMDTKFLRAYLEQRSARIKDIVDKQIKPLYKLRVIKPQPLETTADEPAQVPPPRERGSSRSNVSYPADIPPINPNQPRMTRNRLNELVHERLANATLSTPIPTPYYPEAELGAPVFTTQSLEQMIEEVQNMTTRAA